MNNKPAAMQYPPDVLSAHSDLDVINSQEAQTIDQVFRERVRRSPDKTAFTQYDAQLERWHGLTWGEMAGLVERWQVAFRDSGLRKGDRVAICHANSIEWVVFDQAALRLGLVVVPLYTGDRPENLAYVVADSAAKLVLLSNARTWENALATGLDLSAVELVLAFSGSAPGVTMVTDWLPQQGQHLARGMAEPDDLASIVYTSGTTGRPKGVMLSHRNMLANAYSALRSVVVKPSDELLSFLPLSHMFERTAGYYTVLLSGCSLTFNRSIAELANDLKVIQPTMMVTVPRIFERMHKQIQASVSAMNPLKRFLFNAALSVGWSRFEYRQGLAPWQPKLLFSGVLDRLVARGIRAKLGGELNYVIVGGAPLCPKISKSFIALGIPLLQGYGLTEASPVVSVNTPEFNRPDSIGLPLRGVTVRIGGDNELWVKGDSVMQGYWNDPAATEQSIVEDDAGRWLRTGDCASIDSQGFIRIIGRIKDILVMDNGEKVPPSEIEAAILANPLFEQAMLVGEGRPFLSALVVLNQELWQQLCADQGWPEDTDSKHLRNHLLKTIAQQMQQFPGYARVRRVHVCDQEWTVESGLLTPTMKIKRALVLQQFSKQIEAFYQERQTASL